MTILKNYNVTKNEQHPFHMVDSSPWPLMTSFSLLGLAFSFLSYFHFFKGGNYHFLISFLIVCFYLFRWFSDIVVESTFEGNHTFKVQEGVRLGMFLFIVSEMMFVWVRKLRRINYEFYIHNSSTY
jgi:hypothetical protein